MAPRAYWKGYLKLSLVSCPIALNPAASSSERVSFRQINKKTGNRCVSSSSMTKRASRWMRQTRARATKSPQTSTCS
jgi:DNA end-binding protein Ku